MFRPSWGFFSKKKKKPNKISKQTKQQQKTQKKTNQTKQTKKKQLQAFLFKITKKLRHSLGLWGLLSIQTPACQPHINMKIILPL